VRYRLNTEGPQGAAAAKLVAIVVGSISTFMLLVSFAYLLFGTPSGAAVLGCILGLLLGAGGIVLSAIGFIMGAVAQDED
jgi:hypothetical protein